MKAEHRHTPLTLRLKLMFPWTLSAEMLGRSQNEVTQAFVHTKATGHRVVLLDEFLVNGFLLESGFSVHHNPNPFA